MIALPNAQFKLPFCATGSGQAVHHDMIPNRSAFNEHACPMAKATKPPDTTAHDPQSLRICTARKHAKHFRYARRFAISTASSKLAKENSLDEEAVAVEVDNIIGN